jgi:5'(3')-deoxyribonucleotidase
MSVTIYLDMDGVVADFFLSVCQMYGKEYQESHAKLLPGDWWLTGFLGPITQDDMWMEINRRGEHFWEHMPEYPHSQQLYNKLRNYAPVKFLSDPGPHPHVWAGKVKWLHRFVPGITAKDIHLTADKAAVSAPRRLLVDDHDDNCTRWRNEGGGAVLFPRRWNVRHQEEHQAVDLVLNEVEDWMRRNRPL